MSEKKQFRAWAKTNDIIILTFLKERNSGEMYGVGIKTLKDYSGKPYYTFGKVYRLFAQEFTYEQCGCYSNYNETEIRLHAYGYFGFRPGKITADDIRRAVNVSLSGYPWGGECIKVHKNKWGEWIADCHIWGQYGTSPEDPNWVYYSAGDENCPIRQKMIVVDRDPYRFGFDYPSISMWDAKDDKREPTFVEEGGTMLDPNAPPSPYIVEPIKAYLAEHKNDKPFL